MADQISDAILDDFLRQDPEAKVACETFVSTGLVVICGEVRSENAYVDIQHVTRGVIDRIGYTKADYMFDSKSCGILSALHEQSPDINRGVVNEVKEEQGAGDQGMMFGYACNDTEEYMPLPLTLAHITLIELARIRREEPQLMPYLRPDAKSQYTIEYSDDHKPLRVHTIVVSTQHDDFPAAPGMVPGTPENDAAVQARIKDDIERILLPRVIARLPERTRRLFDGNIVLHVNPTGKFVIGGPHGGKDPSKVDRSAAYAARHIAKNMVAAGVADEILIQLAYAIGIAEPVSIFVNTYGTSRTGLTDGEIAARIRTLFDLRPAAIIERFGLKNPIYLPTASYGHFGRDPFRRKVELIREGRKIEKDIQFFGWELLDSVDLIRKEFGL